MTIETKQCRLIGEIDVLNKKAKLSSIEVKPRFRKSGIGRAMVGYFEYICSKMGIDDVEILAYRKKGVLSFWEKLNYTIDSKVDVVDGVTQDYQHGSKKISACNNTLEASLGEDLIVIFHNGKKYDTSSDAPLELFGSFTSTNKTLKDALFEVNKLNGPDSKNKIKP